MVAELSSRPGPAGLDGNLTYSYASPEALHEARKESTQYKIQERASLLRAAGLPPPSLPALPAETIVQHNLLLHPMGPLPHTASSRRETASSGLGLAGPDQQQHDGKAGGKKRGAAPEPISQQELIASLVVPPELSAKGQEVTGTSKFILGGEAQLYATDKPALRSAAQARDVDVKFKALGHGDDQGPQRRKGLRPSASARHAADHDGGGSTGWGAPQHADASSHGLARTASSPSRRKEKGACKDPAFEKMRSELRSSGVNVFVPVSVQASIAGKGLCSASMAFEQVRQDSSGRLLIHPPSQKQRSSGSGRALDPSDWQGHPRMGGRRGLGDAVSTVHVQEEDLSLRYRQEQERSIKEELGRSRAKRAQGAGQNGHGLGRSRSVSPDKAALQAARGAAAAAAVAVAVAAQPAQLQTSQQRQQQQPSSSHQAAAGSSPDKVAARQKARPASAPRQQAVPQAAITHFAQTIAQKQQEGQKGQRGSEQGQKAARPASANATMRASLGGTASLPWNTSKRPSSATLTAALESLKRGEGIQPVHPGERVARQAGTWAGGTNRTIVNPGGAVRTPKTISAVRTGHVFTLTATERTGEALQGKFQTLTLAEIDARERAAAEAKVKTSLQNRVLMYTIDRANAEGVVRPQEGAPPLGAADGTSAEEAGRGTTTSGRRPDPFVSPLPQRPQRPRSAMPSSATMAPAGSVLGSACVALGLAAPGSGRAGGEAAFTQAASSAGVQPHASPVAPFFASPRVSLTGPVAIDLDAPCLEAIGTARPQSARPQSALVLSAGGVPSKRVRPPSAGAWAGRPKQVVMTEQLLGYESLLGSCWDKSTIDGAAQVVKGSGMLVAAHTMTNGAVA